MVPSPTGSVLVDTETVDTHRNPVDAEVIHTCESHVSIENVHVHRSM